MWEWKVCFKFICFYFGGGNLASTNIYIIINIHVNKSLKIQRLNKQGRNV